MGAQAIAGGSGRVKGGLRLRFPLPVPKSEVWTGWVPDFSLPPKKNNQWPAIWRKSHPRNQTGLSYYRRSPLCAGEDTEAQRREEACPRLTRSWWKC